MDSTIFLKEFPALVQGKNGTRNLRNLILQLAVRGKMMSGVNDTVAYPAWRSATLHNLAAIFSGDSIAASDKAEKYAGQKTGFPYIATKDVVGDDGRINYENGVRIPHGGLGFRTAKPGSILICSEGGSAGKKIGLLTQEVCFGNKLIAVQPTNMILPAFLLLIFQSPDFYADFKSKMTGIIGGISLASFKNLVVRFPSVPEQERIVGKVNELIGLCASTERLQDSGRMLKSAVAAATLRHCAEHAGCAAGQTSLTELLNKFSEWFDAPDSILSLKEMILEFSIRGMIGSRSSENTLAELSSGYIDTRTGEKYLRAARPPSVAIKSVPFDIPKNWAWCDLSSLVNPSKGISYGVIKLGRHDSTGIPVLRCSDVKSRYIDDRNVKKVSQIIEADFQRTRLAGGELLVNVRGTLGGCAIAQQRHAGFNIAREVAMVDPNSLVDARYLLNVLSAPYFQKAVLNNLRGIAYKGLNLGTLAKILIPLPPLNEQLQIIRRTDELMALCDALDKHVQTGIRLNAALMGSLIHQLGEDVPDDDGDPVPFPAEHIKDEIEIPSARVGADIDQSQSGTPADHSQTTSIDSRFQEAVLVGAIVSVFFEDGGEPLGNFRLQKAVYFARRHMKDRTVDKVFLKKAAGPYNPAMKYSGGIAIAKSKNYIREARGRFGFGHIRGNAASELGPWIDRYHYAESARWVRDNFKLRKNAEWGNFGNG